MTPKKYIQILKEQEQLHQNIYKIASEAPETYKIAFEKIARDSNGLEEPTDPLEIVRVWFSAIAHLFNYNPESYPEDVKQLIDTSPENLLANYEASNSDKLITEIKKNIYILKADLIKYLDIFSEKEKIKNNLQDDYLKYVNKKQWEKEFEDRDRVIRTREYKKTYNCSLEKLFETVDFLFLSYNNDQSGGMGGSIEGDEKMYYYLSENLSPYYVLYYENDPRLGHHIFRIEKLYTLESPDLLFEPSVYESIPEFADGAKFYSEIGYITLSQALEDNVSSISVTTENADLLDFFKKMIEKIEISEKDKSNKSGISPRVPKQLKNVNNWKIAWAKVKKGWEKGAEYKTLAEMAGMSPETIADVIKAGNAGLLD